MVRYLARMHSERAGLGAKRAAHLARRDINKEMRSISSKKGKSD